MNQVTKDEELHEFLIKENITWRFNLPRASWWGGQFEPLIGLTKQTLYKSLGKTNLNWNRLEDVKVKVKMNSRSLTYIENDIQYAVLTSNCMILWRKTTVLEKNPEGEDESGKNDNVTSRGAKIRLRGYAKENI